jgi:predicted nucleic acid-binding protein
MGAHAAVRGDRLLSRDVTRYRRYFPTLELIAP